MLLACGDAPAPAVMAAVEACPAPGRLVGDACRAPGIQDDGCPAGTRAVSTHSGACVEAGIQDDGCPAGTVGQSDGSCTPAGMRPEMCPEGWVHDGDAACDPVLPEEPCAPGTMALPGETSCRAMMACGDGTWGDIPIEPGNTVYVDGSYADGDANGTVSRPFPTIGEAVEQAGSGSLVAIAAGTYPEDIRIVNKRLRLWGICPDAVEIAGAPASTALATLQIYNGASDGSEVHGVSITSQTALVGGVAVGGAEDLVLSHILIHDVEAPGLFGSNQNGPTSLVLKAALLERTGNMGIWFGGVDAAVEDVVVRDTQPHATTDERGQGMVVQSGHESVTPSRVTVRRLLLLRNRQVGLFVSSSELDAESLVVRDTLPRASDLERGLGVQVGADSATLASVLRIRGGLIERSHSTGVVVVGGELTLEGAVIRGTSASPRATGLTVTDGDASDPSTAMLRGVLVEDTQDTGMLSFRSDLRLEGVIIRGTTAVDESSGLALSMVEGSLTGRGVRLEQNEAHVLASGGEVTLEGALLRDTRPTIADGRGLSVQSHDESTPASLHLTGSVIEGSHRLGLFVGDSEATVEGVVIRDTQPLASDQSRGFGVVSEPGPWGGRSNLTMRGSVVEGNRGMGVKLLSSDAVLEGVVVRETSPTAEGEWGGLGIFAGPSEITRERSTLRATGSVVERSTDFGFLVAGSDATIDGVTIRTVQPRATTGGFGDAVAAVFDSTVQVVHSDIVDIARAGVTLYGSSAALQSSWIRCAPIALNGQARDGFDFAFRDEGDNRCSCPSGRTGANDACQVSQLLLDGPGLDGPLGSLTEPWASPPQARDEPRSGEN